MQAPAGPFWTALAQAVRHRSKLEPRLGSGRERRPVIYEDYLDSTENISPGSEGSSHTQASAGTETSAGTEASAGTGASAGTKASASSEPPSQKSFDPENEDSTMDEDEHDERRTRPEDVTVRLIGSFLQYALNFCLKQAVDKDHVEVQPRFDRKRSTCKIMGGEVQITAEDDGGIHTLQRNWNGWMQENPYIALLEAKKAFESLDYNDKTNTYEPVVSDKTPAQCLGEAIITWKANPEHVSQE
jgi:hypothetical protein